MGTGGDRSEFNVMRFWPVIAFALVYGFAGVGGWYTVKGMSEANAEDVRELKGRVKETENKANELLRGDDRLKATIELESTKLRAEIERANRAQNQQLDTILQLLQRRN